MLAMSPLGYLFSRLIVDIAQKQEQKSEPDNGADDEYARTFDSPAQDEAPEGAEDVSKASESMNSSSASENMPHQSPVASTPADVSSSNLLHADAAADHDLRHRGDW